MSGGSGERLWPLSRRNLPKQFSNFLGDSLLDLTIKRLSKFDDKPIIISVENQKNFIKNNFINRVISLIEPEAKNTAPAIALLCRYLELHGQSNEVVSVFPADHYINDEGEFYRALSKAEAVSYTHLTLPTTPYV